MLRGLSIVICSIVLSLSALAENYWALEGNHLVAYRVGSPPQSATCTIFRVHSYVRSPLGGGVNTSYTINFRWCNTTTINDVVGPNLMRKQVLQFPNSQGEGTFTFQANSLSGMPAFVFTYTAAEGLQPVSPDPEPTPTPTPIPTPTPEAEAEYEFEYTFGPEYGGSVVTLFAADGSVLASYTIPEGGTVLQGEVYAASLEGAFWDVDGVYAGAIDDATTAPNTSVARPGYEFGFAPSFDGGEWKAERGDGLVVGGGPIAPGTADVGRVTIGQGDAVTVYTRVPAGDGMGSAWVPSSVTLVGSDVTTRHFFTPSTSPTNAPAPLPTPTPIPIPTPAPTSGMVTTNVTTNNLANDEVVSLDVADADVPDPDFGAEELVEQAQSIFGKVAEGYENFAEAFTTGALTFNEFKNLYLPPPGSNCIFEMGPVTINLSTTLPGWVRGASKIVFLFCALGAMMRMLWEAFA